MNSLLQNKLFINSAMLVFLILIVVVANNFESDQVPELSDTLYRSEIGQSVSDVEISNRSQTVRLEKEGGDEERWKIVSVQDKLQDGFPVAIIESSYADNTKMQHLFTFLDEPVIDTFAVPSDDEDLEQYGLLDSLRSISFNGVRYDFGKINKVHQHRYVRSGQTIYLVDETISVLLEEGLRGLQQGTDIITESDAANNAEASDDSAAQQSTESQR